MSIRSRVVVIVAVFLALAPMAAFAQNNTSATSVHLSLGQYPVNMGLGAAPNTQRWYDIQVRPARSYCVEVTSDYWFYYLQNDPVVDVFGPDGTTLYANNDDVQTEPDTNYQSRACWMDFTAVAAGVQRYIRVTQVGTTAHNYVMRVYETSLWSSWYFVGGDYNSFLLMRNTTDATISFAVQWHNAAGTVVGFTPILTVPAHGGVGINGKTYIPDPVTNFNGTVNIFHDGPPNGLVGQMTSLSSSTGLGFDAPLFMRVPW